MPLNIHLQLPPEYVDALRQQAAAHGDDIDAYVSQIVAENLHAEVAATRQSICSTTSFGEWLKAWVARHPKLEHLVDDSRESIYAGCGE